MSIDYIEDVAREKDLRDKDHQEYERLLNEAIGQEESFTLWNRLYIITAAIFFWSLLFTAVVFLMAFDYEFEMPGGLGIGLTVLLVADFPMFLIFMFLSAKHSRELAAHEARVLGFLEAH